MGRFGCAQDVDRRGGLAACGRYPGDLSDRDDRKAIRRYVTKLGGPEGLAVAYEAGPGGFALWRLLASMGVACDVIAPSLIPV